MKILILGGGSSQVNAIARAREKGLTVIVSDYYPDAPGKALAHHAELVSTFDVEQSIEIAKKHQADGVLTLGTDQPVYTAACIARELHLPSPISVETALAVTNKKVMKKIFKEGGIPTPDFIFLKKGFFFGELADLRFPVVMKPLDSQGQRGVYRLESPEEIEQYLPDTLSHSRLEEVIVEEYYENQEITVSGWVDETRPHVLTITDRLSFNNYPHLGICSAHRFPSLFLRSHYDEIMELTSNIVRVFGIKNGPIYFQMLVGREGIKVNEISCRLGGAYEDEFIPYLTGIDILGLLFDMALGKKLDLAGLRDYDLYNNSKRVLVPLIFARPGKVHKLPELEHIKRQPGILQAQLFIKPGQIIPEMINATQRVGYMIIAGDDEETLAVRIKKAFEAYVVENEAHENLIVKEGF